jgi:hypothetical protein
MEVTDLLTLSGAAIIVTIVVEVVKRAAALTEAQVTRFGPLLAIVIGIAATVGASVAKSAPLDAAILTGLLAGATASGVYSFTKAVR